MVLFVDWVYVVEVLVVMCYFFELFIGDVVFLCDVVQEGDYIFLIFWVVEVCQQDGVIGDWSGYEGCVVGGSR